MATQNEQKLVDNSNAEVADNFIAKLATNPSLVAIDVAANQLLGGDRETISARVGRTRLTSPISAVIAPVLDAIDPDHVGKSMRKWDKIHAAEKAQKAAGMANFSFTSPDGKTHDVTAPAGTPPEEVFAQLQQHLAANPTPPPSPGQRMMNDVGRSVGLAARMPLQAVAGMAGVIADPIMGLTNIGRNIAAKAQGEPMPKQLEMPSVAYSKLLTQLGLPQASSPAEKLQDVVGTAMVGGIDPIARAAIKAIQGTAPLYNNLAGSDKVKTIQEGMDLGLKVSPSEAAGGGGPVTKGLEALGGSAPLNQILASKNQPLVDALAKKTVGLPNTAPLTRDTLKAAIDNTYQSSYAPIKALPIIQNGGIYRRELNAVMQQFGNAAPGARNQGVQDLVNAYRTQSFTGDEAVNYIKALRTNATKAFASTEAGSNELGLANRAIADAIENSVSLNLQRNPAYANQPGLFNNFLAGRKLMAQQHAVQDAIKEGTGSVDPQAFANILNSGKPLTGDLRTVAKMVNTAPQAMKMPTSDPKLFTPWESTVGTLGLGSAMAGAPSGLIGVGIPISRYGARHALGTDLMQRMIRPTDTPKDMTGMIQRLPATMQQLGLYNSLYNNREQQP